MEFIGQLMRWDSNDVWPAILAAEKVGRDSAWLVLLFGLTVVMIGLAVEPWWVCLTAKPVNINSNFTPEFNHFASSAPTMNRKMI